MCFHFEQASDTRTDHLNSHSHSSSHDTTAGLTRNVHSQTQVKLGRPPLPAEYAEALGGFLSAVSKR